MPPDQVEISCAFCLRRFDAMAVPKEVFPCSFCGATLRPDLIHVLHHVSTTLVAAPSDYSDDDPTPVQTPVPLRAAREQGEKG